MRAPPGPTNTLRRNGRSAIVLIHAALLGGIVFLGATWPSLCLHVPIELLIQCACLALLVLFAWSWWSWRMLTGSWLDPYSFFLLAANAFNAGQAFLEVFHLNPAGLLSGLFAPETLLKTLLLVLLGLWGLHFGALLAAFQTGESLPSAQPATGGSLPSSTDVATVGWLLLLVSVPPTILFLRSAVTVVLTSGYFSLYQREAAIGVSNTPKILSAFLIPAALFLLAGGKNSRSRIVASGIVVLANAGCQLFLGFRYYATMPLLVYVWVWHRSIRPVPRWALFGSAALLLAVVFPLVGATRNVRGEDRLSVDYLSTAFTGLDNPAVRSVNEMGGSMRTIAHTVELIPTERDYDYGGLYFYGMLTVVPNLFWEIHPSVAYGTSSNWLIWTVDPETAALGGGLGYSFIAEAYLNFGWIGTPLVIALLGFLYARFVLWGMRSPVRAPANLAVVACFCSFFTFYAREDVAVVFRSLVWYSLGPYLLTFLVYSLRRSLTLGHLPATAAL